MEVVVKKYVVDGLLNGARSAYPHEFFCLLGGEMKDETVYIDEIVFVPYRSSRVSATFDVWSLPVMDRIVGSAHSHPIRSPPSSGDLHSFPYTGVVHAIIYPPFVESSSIVFFDNLGRRVSWRLEGQ